MAGQKFCPVIVKSIAFRIRGVTTEKFMEKKDIGYNCIELGVGYLLLFIMFLVLGIVISAETGWEDFVFVLINGALLLCALFFAFLAGSILIRPKTLVQADEKNVYIFQWRGMESVPLAEIERVAVMQNKLPIFDCGRLSVRLYNGKCVRISGLKDPQGVRVSIEVRTQMLRK